MAALTFDIGDKGAFSCFPAHGWAVSSEGHKLLWLPAIRLVRSVEAIRSAKGVSPPARGSTQEAWRLEHTFRNLAATLRELHQIGRVVGDLPSAVEDWPEEVRSTDQINTLTPVFVDAAYLYLRRLGTDVARAFRHVLFANPEGAPAGLQDWPGIVSESHKLASLNPICDVDLLRHALDTQLGWLEQLRGMFEVDGEPRKGFRDALEHRPVVIGVQFARAEGEPWRLGAHLSGPRVPADVLRDELIGRMRKLLGECCQFLAALCLSAERHGRYVFGVVPNGDCLVLTGAFDDVTGFWPRIVCE